VYFSLLTLALSAMLYAVSFRWTDVTGGENGLGGITRPTLLGVNLGILHQLLLVRRAIAFAVLICCGASIIRPSAACWSAIRENEQRARFLGYPTNRYKLAAFVLSAGNHRGLPASCCLFQNRMTSADPISVSFSGDLLAMVVIGGMRSFLGPALGGAVLHPVPRVSRHLHRELAVLVRPGVRRLHRVFADRARRRRRAADRAVPQEDIRRCCDVGAPHRGHCRCRNSCGQNPMSRDPCCRRAISSRALAASRRAGHRYLDQGFVPLHALIGPNGAGKTTAFNLLSGMFPPDEGRVSLMGQPIEGHTPEENCARRHRPLFPDHQPVSGAQRRREHPPRRCRRGHPSASIPSPTRCRSRRSMPRTDATIRYLGLAGIEKAEAGKLSYGGQRLLDMGVALATAPRVLLLDEPLAGLAAAERERIGAIIKRHLADLPVLLVEARHRPVFQLADHVTVMNEGRCCSTARSKSARQPRRCRKSISAPAPQSRRDAARDRRPRQRAADGNQCRHLLRQEPHPQRRQLHAARKRDHRAARPQRRRQVRRC
jgi:ABC-type branched-subunit amino acid transport system ATPase component